MPHKHNPVICEGVVAVGHAHHRASISLMKQAMIIDHRARPSPRCGSSIDAAGMLPVVGTMLAQMIVLGGLEVHAATMRRNLDTLGGFLMSGG